MNLIKFQIRETAKDELLMEDFVSEWEGIKKVLDSLNKDLHPTKTPQLIFKIIKIKKESPMYAEILPTIIGTENGDLVNSFYHCLRAIKRKKAPKGFSIDTVKAYSQIGKSTPKNEIIFFENGDNKKLKIKNSLENFVNEIYKHTYYTESGSIGGKLDALNLHGTKKVITIYPNYAPAITCDISDDLIPIVEKAIRKKVTITGKLKTKIGEKYPYEIIVKDIKIHKSKENIPSVEELWGMMNTQYN